MLTLDWKKFAVPVLILILVYSLASNFLQNSNTGVIGYDEGIYIINAMGHYEDTPIEQPHGNWLDSIEKGMMRTGDPPGSFLILHFWEKISMSERWLRLLPFIFLLSKVSPGIYSYILSIPDNLKRNYIATS